MSANTYFYNPRRMGDAHVFVTIDPNERRRLRLRGWIKIDRRTAISKLGGTKPFRRALAHCRTGLIDRDLLDGRCLGHGASSERLGGQR